MQLLGSSTSIKKGAVWSWYTLYHKINVMERAGWIERMRAYPEAWRDTRRLTEAGVVLT